MPKGKISLQIIKRRLEKPGVKISEKYDIEGKIILTSIMNEGKRYFHCMVYQNINRRNKVDKNRTTIYQPFGKYCISRDELAFVRLLSQLPIFGAGDYCVKMWGKGKKKGFRAFWDGLILQNKKFMRRRAGSMGIFNLSVSERDSGSSYEIGKYMKTKQPVGKWHDF